MANSTPAKAPEKIIFDIESAPSKFDLMVSLMRGTMDNQDWVTFSIRDRENRAVPATVKVRIQMAAREDGSGDNWLFEGCAKYGAPLDKSMVLTPALKEFFIKPENWRVHGHFNTVRRTGWITAGSSMSFS